MLKTVSITDRVCPGSDQVELTLPNGNKHYFNRAREGGPEPLEIEADERVFAELERDGYEISTAKKTAKKKATRTKAKKKSTTRKARTKAKKKSTTRKARTKAKATPEAATEADSA